MKIHISNYYFACRLNVDKYKAIRIDRYPSSHHRLHNAKELITLAPDKEDVDAYVINKTMDRDTYIKNFKATLAKLDPYQIVADIRELSPDKIPVLVCHCGMDDFCHRNLVKDWLVGHIPELDITPYDTPDLEYDFSLLIYQFIDKYRFLSNFWRHPKITYKIFDERYGFIFLEATCAENIYQALKGLGVCDVTEILNAENPSVCKKLGKKIEVRPDWDDVKLGFMKQILENKFNIPQLRDKLLVTGNLELIEGNHWRDIFWGRCGGVGENHLGKLLMELRRKYATG